MPWPCRQVTKRWSEAQVTWLSEDTPRTGSTRTWAHVVRLCQSSGNSTVCWTTSKPHCNNERREVKSKPFGFANQAFHGLQPTVFKQRKKIQSNDYESTQPSFHRHYWDYWLLRFRLITAVWHHYTKSKVLLLHAKKQLLVHNASVSQHFLYINVTICTIVPYTNNPSLMLITKSDSYDMRMWKKTYSEVWCLRSSRKKMQRSGWPLCGCQDCSHLTFHKHKRVNMTLWSCWRAVISSYHSGNLISL